jgi:WD40 repeat protein
MPAGLCLLSVRHPFPWLFSLDAHSVPRLGVSRNGPRVYTRTGTNYYIQSLGVLVWDIQTGVSLWDIQTGAPISYIKTGTPLLDIVTQAIKTGVSPQDIVNPTSNIAFSGDQRTTTLTKGQHFFTYDGLNGTMLHQGQLPPSDNYHLGAQWAHKESLWVATISKTNGNPVINILELQPPPNPSHPTVKSFPVLPHNGKFSFSPVSFHASFITESEVIILDVQGPKTLFNTKATQPLYEPPGLFSPDGSFFACGTLEHNICIWRNTPTSYIPWGTLQPRLPFNNFSFSPTAISILTWDPEGIQLLHLGNSISPLSPNEIKPFHQPGKHLVACSTDGAHLATAQLNNGIITVLDPHLGTPLHSIHTGVQIQDMKIVDATIFVADGHRLLSWNLKAGGGTTICGSHNNVAVGVDVRKAKNLVLSDDCSWIALAVREKVFLYNIKAQEIVAGEVYGEVVDIKFSQNGHWMYALSTFTTVQTQFQLTKFKMASGHAASVTTVGQEDEAQWVSLVQSPYGYSVRSRSKWVVDPRGHKCLWLPPHWRTTHGLGVGWKGNFLALVGSHHQKPIIIEFQPQPFSFIHHQHQLIHH